jgi:predicted RNA binding protein YcfA (HicA-like mRNA interferase family)
MSSLPCISGKEAIGALEKAGFVVCRITGSHHIMKRDGHRLLVTVPVHGSCALKPGTLRGIIRSAGLTVEQFNSLL